MCLGRQAGLIRAVGAFLTDVVAAVGEAQRELVSVVLLVWVSALVSAFLDTLPYTATMVPVVEHLARGNNELRFGASDPRARACALVVRGVGGVGAVG